jgi:hypothetical protein
MSRWLLYMGLAVGMPVIVHASADFSRYAVILERRPFSAPVVDVPPAPVVVDEVPPFVQELRMVAITDSPAGIRVGFLRQRPPKTYFLYVGESEDGILLADADFDEEKALVSKDGLQYWMTMNTGGGSGEGAASRPQSEQAAAGVRRGRGAAMRPPPQPAPGEAQDSYAERRRQRLEEMRRRAEESRNLSEEEVERQLREYQMRLIREGRTPLPIPITEEMDAQLVAEGILPAVE